MQQMQEMWVWFLEREDPLEKEMATHCSILAWKIPWTEEPGRLQPRHDLVSNWAATAVLSCWGQHGQRDGQRAFPWLQPLSQGSPVFRALAQDAHGSRPGEWKKGRKNQHLQLLVCRMLTQLKDTPLSDPKWLALDFLLENWEIWLLPCQRSGTYLASQEALSAACLGCLRNSRQDWQEGTGHTDFPWVLVTRVWVYLDLNYFLRFTVGMDWTIKTFPEPSPHTVGFSDSHHLLSLRKTVYTVPKKRHVRLYTSNIMAACSCRVNIFILDFQRTAHMQITVSAPQSPLSPHCLSSLHSIFPTHTYSYLLNTLPHCFTFHSDTHIFHTTWLF